MKNVLNIKNIINNKYAVSTEDAENILLLIKKSLNNNQEIEISFEGIEIVISAFLNRILGDLYAEYSKEQINNLISFSNTNNNIDDLIELIKETAEEFYKKKNGNL